MKDMFEKQNKLPYEMPLLLELELKCANIIAGSSKPEDDNDNVTGDDGGASEG